MKNTMTFTLDEEETKKYRDWRDKLDKVDYGAIGGGYWFMFCPTGLGNCVKVRRDDGEEIDLTNVDNW